MMTRAELLLARQRTYQLFSRLYAHGPSADLLPLLAEIPQLAAHLPARLDADQAAAAHYQTFSDTALPFESIFRDPSGLLFGDLTAVVDAFYRELRFEPAAEPDALSSELAFLAFLGSEEGHALARGHEPQVALLQQQQARFLNDHLLVWLAPFAAALEHGRAPFYAALAELTLALAAEHWAELAARPAVPDLPPVPDLLHEASTSLRQISGTLLTPPYSGFYLSRDTIGELARRRKLPRGFGKRRQILRNLLETAGQYDSAALVLDDLSAVAVSFARTYERQLGGLPALGPFLRPWQERLVATQELLAEMRGLTSSTS